jgi:transcriptional regulator with XRE-family HTH domain
MSENERQLTARYVVARHLSTVRSRVGMDSAQELADRVKALGGKLDRAAISKIESGTRNVSLDEALLLAAALDVAPVHLFFPLNDDAEVEIAPGLQPVRTADARAWLRGLAPLPGRNEQTYRSAWIPPSEYERDRARLHAAEAELETADRRHRVAREKLDLLTAERGRLDLSPYGLAATGVDPNQAHQRADRLDQRLDVAYDLVAEAKVEFEDAKRRLLRIQAEDGARDGQR